MVTVMTIVAAVAIWCTMRCIYTIGEMERNASCSVLVYIVKKRVSV